MTNEEKFRAGTVVYKDDDGDYVCELWEASTRHPDVVYHMNADGKYKKAACMTMTSMRFFSGSYLLLGI